MSEKGDNEVPNKNVQNHLKLVHFNPELETNVGKGEEDNDEIELVEEVDEPSQALLYKALDEICMFIHKSEYVYDYIHGMAAHQKGKYAMLFNTTARLKREAGVKDAREPGEPDQIEEALVGFAFRDLAEHVYMGASLFRIPPEPDIRSNSNSTSD